MSNLSIQLESNYNSIFELFKNNKLILDENEKQTLLIYVFNQYVKEYKNNLKKYNTTQDKKIGRAHV